MSDSESSDYVVEDYIKPDTVRYTNDNKDLLSESDEESDSAKSESEHSEVEEIQDSQCKLNGVKNIATNGKRNKSDEEEVEAEPLRANSRYILYVTNLSSETTRSMLEDFFGDAGEIKSIRIPKVRLGSYAFVEMKDVEGYKVMDELKYFLLKYNIKFIINLFILRAD